MEVRGKSWYYINLILILTFFLVTFNLGFSYVETEINTNLSLNEFNNLEELCPKKDLDFKYAKVVTFEKARRFSRIYCIYEDPSKNVQLDMNHTGGKWQPYFRQNLNQDRNIYWPIYI